MSGAAPTASLDARFHSASLNKIKERLIDLTALGYDELLFVLKRLDQEVDFMSGIEKTLT